ncbi:2-hydroxyhepta-2,4-diene-1,7-dioate isomerase [Afipia sp. P52-10]|uniref:fumarylacetoacetate hydrolase family protein n=1 Tax=Afipia sp. P52-10 TaxID=1429916 RepID=UPI0003DF1DFE|nr:fumarylacetoacetate hydrolase family protein [Afipia sp. P52-10]ETR77060.1 2-hydroxyhepta-2,4-diene-1,7-dioate isomerase [Afipia sp. P52-10]
MKLVRFGGVGQERPGILDKDGHIRDLSAHVKDISGEVLSEEGLQRIGAIDPLSLPRMPDGVRLGAPVATPSKFVAIGLNYADHAAETGAAIPKEPIIFLKAVTSMSGPHDPVEKPRDSTKLDWEVELGLIIGKRAKYVEEADALSHVAGYCLANDVSERNFQIEREGQWTKGKSHDTFGPLGPWLVTKDEIADPQNLSMWLDVNGERQQTGTTATMIFKIPKIIAYVSRFMTLLPGDVIVTGTPPGVGSGKKPQRFLNVGDVVTLGVEGLGTQRQQIVAA